MKKILIAVDGSEYSLEAVKLIKGLSVTPNANEIYLVNVQNYTFPSEPYHSFGTEESVRELLKDRGTKIMKDFEKLFEGEKVHTEIRVGDTVTEILKYAHEIGAEMIVAGSHGKTGLTSIVMGSTTAKLMSTSPIPVLIYNKK